MAHAHCRGKRMAKKDLLAVAERLGGIPAWQIKFASQDSPKGRKKTESQAH